MALQGKLQRVVIAFGIISSFSLIAWLATHAAQVQIVRASGGAHRGDPIALNWESKQAIHLAKNDQQELERAVLHAKESLKLQSLNPGALAVIGVVSAAMEKPWVSRRYLYLSSSSSRRELMTHIANIEDRVNEDDAVGALRHYDLALRVSKEAPALLFPVLKDAIADPFIRMALADYVRSGAKWVPQFTNHVLAQPDGLEHLAEIVRIAGGFGKLDPNGDFALLLVGALVESGYIMKARDQFVASFPDRAGVLASASLTPGSFGKRAGRLGWKLNEMDDHGAVQAQRGGVVVYANSNSRGVVATKPLFLTTGQYYMALSVINEGSAGTKAQWQLACAANSEQRPLFDSGERLIASFSGPNTAIPFNVPSSCLAQTLTLSVVGPDSQEEAQFWIKSIALEKVRAMP